MLMVGLQGFCQDRCLRDTVKPKQSYENKKKQKRRKQNTYKEKTKTPQTNRPLGNFTIHYEHTGHEMTTKCLNLAPKFIFCGYVEEHGKHLTLFAPQSPSTVQRSERFAIHILPLLKPLILAVFLSRTSLRIAFKL